MANPFLRPVAGIGRALLTALQALGEGVRGVQMQEKLGPDWREILEAQRRKRELELRGLEFDQQQAPLIARSRELANLTAQQGLTDRAAQFRASQLLGERERIADVPQEQAILGGEGVGEGGGFAVNLPSAEATPTPLPSLPPALVSATGHSEEAIERAATGLLPERKSRLAEQAATNRVLLQSSRDTAAAGRQQFGEGKKDERQDKTLRLREAITRLQDARRRQALGLGERSLSLREREAGRSEEAAAVQQLKAQVAVIQAERRNIIERHRLGLLDDEIAKATLIRLDNELLEIQSALEAGGQPPPAENRPASPRPPRPSQPPRRPSREGAAGGGGASAPPYPAAQHPGRRIQGPDGSVWISDGTRWVKQ